MITIATHHGNKHYQKTRKGEKERERDAEKKAISTCDYYIVILKRAKQNKQIKKK